MREEFGGGAAYRCSLYGLYLGGSKFYLSLLLRIIWYSTSNSSKHRVYIGHQVHNSLSALIYWMLYVKVVIVGVSVVLRSGYLWMYPTLWIGGSSRG